MIKKVKQLAYYEGIGRRREAVARVRLYIVGREKSVTVEGAKLEAGQIMVNKKPVDKVFSAIFEKERIILPFKLTSTEGRFVVSIRLYGGGTVGRLEAILHGTARALIQVDKDTYRPILKKEGYLTRDPRTRERRKVGTGGKARRQKQSPKR